MLLPPGVIQPFFLRYRRDELHIMAFFVGHPDYEAVEAMIRRRPGGAHAIRAILTRHDQTQIDHINDDGLAAEIRGAQRQLHRCDIDLRLEPETGARHARLEFVSIRGERIVLDLVTAGLPDPAGAGLTDPGQHSATSSLPLMWRQASALAGPRTRVAIGGVPYSVPEKLRRPAFVAHEGYYTEGHCMAVIRAGTVSMRLAQQPEALDIGAAWRFETEAGPIAWRVAEVLPGGGLRLEKEGVAGESVIARRRGDRLQLARIDLPGDGGSPASLGMDFDDDGEFRMSIGGAGNLVTGCASTEDTAAGALITLRPEQPAWASRRPVQVACSRDGATSTFVTTVGELNPA